MEEYIVNLAKKYGSRILRNRSSSRRIAAMTGCSVHDAPKVRQAARELADGTLNRAAPTTPEDLLWDKAYTYDEKEDTYVTFLAGVPKPMVLPGSTHRAIVRAYSNYDGSAHTINEMAQEFGIPTNWLRKYLRAHEMTHDREPFTPEELLNRSQDDLAEEGLQLLRASTYKRLAKDKWAQIKKDAERWQNYQVHTLRVLEEALSKRVRAEPVELDISSSIGDPFIGVIGMSDLHFGKYGNEAECGEDYNKEIARERLFDATEFVFSKMARFGKPDRLIVPVGSDAAHVDTYFGTTTKGTPQDLDGTPPEMFVELCHLYEDWIETIRTATKHVELILMSGNHDRFLGLALLMYLDALYRNVPEVTVRRDRAPRVYTAFGRNLIGFAHGDGVSKTSELASHMANEASQHWHDCPERTIYTGNYHTERTEVYGPLSVTRRQLPSLSGTDRWHAEKGYVNAPKGMPLYLHDYYDGLIATIHSHA